METEETIIELLKKAEQHWPETLWLLAEGGQIHIMRTGKNGEHVIHNHTGGFDQTFLIDTITIDSDGGGW